MNQKGFVNTVLIVLVVLLVGVVGYFILPSLITKDTLPQALPASNLKTYRNDKYRFEVTYPSNFVFQDSQSTPDLWLITKLRDGRVSESVDCGGFLKGSDEIGFSWSVFDKQNPEYAGVNVVQAIENRYNTSKYIQVLIGDKSLKVQRSIPGMCGNSDEFIWMEPLGRYIVLFNVSPSNTTLVDEYEAIIASFKFF